MKTMRDWLPRSIRNYIPAICLAAMMLASCDQFVKGYLCNGSSYNITLRIGRPTYHPVRDSSGRYVNERRLEWETIHLRPDSCIMIGDHLGTVFSQPMCDSVEAEGRGFSLRLSRGVILDLPMDNHRYHYYYQIGWKRRE